MIHLNGWQRAWIVFLVIWAVIVGWFVYMLVPTEVSHFNQESNPEVVAHMTTRSWRGDDCKVHDQIELANGRSIAVRDNLIIIDRADENLDEHGKPIDLKAAAKMNRDQLRHALQRMADAGEPDRNLELVASAYAAFRITRVEVPLDGASQKATLCFSRDIPETEMERISADYYAAYAKTLTAQRWRFGALAVAYWLVPGLVAYALGWAVGWVWRGFKRPPDASPSR